VDSRLARLAEFFGIPVQFLPLESYLPPSPSNLDRAIGEGEGCFVVNPRVLGKWFSNEGTASELRSYLVSRFPFILVHNLHPEPVSADTIACLSAGRFQAVQAIPSSDLSYTFPKDARDVCGPYSGLSFGPTNPATDRVLVGDRSDGNMQTLIEIDGHPFFARLPSPASEIFFLGSGDVVDLDEETRDTSLIGYFSRFAPLLMAMRKAFGEACWRPNNPYASLIIDDPYLRDHYGYLNFRNVLALMDARQFHTSIAFIPYNYRRNSPEIVRLFRERPDRYSLCVHGNDHTAAEFTEREPARLNSMIQTALSRMNALAKKTGLSYDNVFVFPQGNFSVSALNLLKANNFCAAVNSRPFPQEEAASLSVADFARPAIMKYGGFPLFLRRGVRDTRPEHVAFALLIGKPVLIVEHHSVFQHPERIAEVVARVNAIAPEIRWSSLGAGLMQSYLQRRTTEGTLEIQTFACSGMVKNNSQASLRCLVVKREGLPVSLDHVVLDGESTCNFTAQNGDVRFSFDVPPRAFRTFSLVYHNDFGLADVNGGWRRDFGVFLRRRLSDARDNYLSKSQTFLSLANYVYERMRRK